MVRICVGLVSWLMGVLAAISLLALVRFTTFSQLFPLVSPGRVEMEGSFRGISFNLRTFVGGCSVSFT